MAKKNWNHEPKDERFEMLMRRSCKRALTKLALQRDMSRAEVVDQLIFREAIRKKVWK